MPRFAADVDLDAVRDNVRTLLRCAGDAAVMAVVKADGYGHGMVPCARASLDGGASWLGVAFIEEALALRAAGVAARLGVRPQLRHLANSAATLALPDTHYDLVRPGVAVYGLSPGPAVGAPAALGLRPAMRLRADAAVVKRVGAGQGVSYGHRYT